MINAEAQRSPRYVRVSRRICVECLLSILLLTSVGCAPPRVDESAPPTEPSLTEQIAAVRAAASDKIELLDTPVTDDKVKQLDGLTNLKLLRLDEAPITDNGIAPILSLQNLEVLNLPRAKFTDVAIEQFTALPHLRILRFGSPNVTDAALARVRDMPALRALILEDSPITDAALKHLYGLQDLESFYVSGTQITTDGLAELQEALPELHIHDQGSHLPGDKHAHDH